MYQEPTRLPTSLEIKEQIHTQGVLVRNNAWLGRIRGYKNEGDRGAIEPFSNNPTRKKGDTEGSELEVSCKGRRRAEGWQL